MSFFNRYNITLLAQAYCGDQDPANARRKMNYLLHSCPELWEELAGAHYRSRQRFFTPKQYEIVTRYLGEPE